MGVGVRLSLLTLFLGYRSLVGVVPPWAAGGGGLLEDENQ